MVTQTVQRETFKHFRTVLSRRRGRTGGGIRSCWTLWRTFLVHIHALPYLHLCWLWQFLSLSPSAAHEELLTHPFQIFRGRWCLPGGLWDMLEPCSYFWHGIFLPLHLEILLTKSQLRSKPSLAELHCHKTSKPTPAQLFFCLTPQHNPQKSVRARRAGF